MTDSVYERGRDQPPSIAVVTAVADVTDESPLALEPLHSTVDAGALDEILEGADTKDSHVAISFEYAGCEVTVTRDEVRVTERE